MRQENEGVRSFEINQKELVELLEDRELMPKDRAEAMVHALCDIGESIERVFAELVPALVRSKDADPQFVKDRLWDLREEFRHIDYHIHDGGFIDL